MCHATAARAAANRIAAKPYEKTEPDRDGRHPLDGVLAWVSPEDLEALKGGAIG